MNIDYIIVIAGGAAIVTFTVLSVMYYLTVVTRPKHKHDDQIKWSDYLSVFTDSFSRKKFLYLSFIALLNAGLSTVAFLYSSQQAVFITLIILKSKDVIMTTVQVVCVIVAFVKRYILRRVQTPMVVTPSNIVTIIPVYSEPKEQIDVTINSSMDNQIGQHRQLICVICDGLDVNVQDDLTETLHESTEAYVSWKQEHNELRITYGKIKDTPCVIMKKVKNQGKKDTLIVSHDIFNHPRTNITKETLKLRETVRQNVKTFYDMDGFEFMFCTDADSLIVKGSFIHLIDTIERRQAVACCGLVVIDFAEGKWGFWNIFQNFQYLYGQYIRRGTENIYGKVSCLPGCITMFKICETASKAIAMYSELPDNHEMLKSIVQMLGTDRRLTASFLYQGKNVITAYDPRAKCYTIPPSTLKSYLSQRRRWGSNAYFNTLCNLVGPNVHILMRMFCFMDYVRMSIEYVRIFNTILFVYSLTQGVVVYTIIPFVAVMAFPTTFFMIRALCSGFLRKMYVKLMIGYFFNKVFSMAISIMIISNVMYNIGSAKWGGNQKETEAVPPQPEQTPDWPIEVVVQSQDTAQR